MTMNVQGILEKHLKENGYDGLCNYDDCGCALDDLCPCGSPSDSCEPGYFQDEKQDGYDFIIGPNKPKEEDKS